jgi:hypothetical protein
VAIPVRGARRLGALGDRAWPIGRVSGIEIAIDRSALSSLVRIRLTTAARLSGSNPGLGLVEPRSTKAR